jgi:hypothetical protein
MVPVEGARLQRIGEQCWVADRELTYAGRGLLPLRMVVVKGPDDELTLYSPVELDEGTREALAGLGRVARVIAPNRFHRSFVGRVLDAFPDAELLVPEANGGLLKRFGNRARVITGLEVMSPGLELVPVKLRDGLVELVLYHDLSETLIVADLLFNLQQAASPLIRFALSLNGVWRRPGQSRLQRLLIVKDVSGLAGFYRWALSKPFAQIAMAHGQLITANAREQFYQIFSRYGR